MHDVLMIKYGEIILKGLNRPQFEEKLIKNIRIRLSDIGEAEVYKYQAAVYVKPLIDNYDYERAIEKLKKIFGIIYISKVKCLDKDIEIIKKEALNSLLMEEYKGKSFKVEVKRPDKKFPLKSPEIQQIVGDYIYERVENEMTVDVKNPDITVTVEIRFEGAFVYAQRIEGPGGLPTGINGKCALMLSGGIDSPVAGYMIGKRGVNLIAVHFHSYPYTSERAKLKVLDLAKKMSEYVGTIPVFVVPFTDIQLLINEKANHDMMVIMMRRYMMKITEEIAKRERAGAIVTGESLGQVASQTIQSISVTNEVATLPVFRPLIGMDKEEITKISRKIDTFSLSILPYEDCCTVFVPKHPKTKPRISDVLEEETKLEGIEELVKKAIDDTELIIVKG